MGNDNGKTKIVTEPGTPQCVITREFDAPPALLFRAYTDPKLLAQWLGPRHVVMVNEQFDVRNGGLWRYVHRDENGNDYGFHGVYHGEPSAERGIVQTFEFEGVPGHVSMETVTFEARAGGKTLVRTNDVFQSVEDRDAMIASGMEVGVLESHERLEALLARLQQAS